MRALFTAFVNSSFGHARDGRPVFMPFGTAGASYLVETQAHLDRMRRQLGRLSALPAVSTIGLLALFFDPVRKAAFVPILLITAASLTAFLSIFLVWVWRNTRSMAKLEQEDGILIQTDPLEAGATAIRSHLSLHARTDNLADLFSAAGALAGFACQMAVRDGAQLEGRGSGLLEIGLKDGRVLYFGDVLNGPLAEDVPSLWSIVGDGAPMSDIHDMFKDAISTLTGNPDSSILKVLLTDVQKHWPAVVTILDAQDVPVTSRHLALARAIRAERNSQDALPGDRVARIVMRAAILMSKWDPAEILVPDQGDDTNASTARS